MSGVSALSRRAFFGGLAAALAAPAVVRASSIMPVKPIPWRVVTTEASPIEGALGEWHGFPWVGYDAALDRAFNVGAEAMRRQLIDPPVVMREVVREFATREEAETAARTAAISEAAFYGVGARFFDDAGRTITVGQMSDMADLCRPHETILTTCSVGDSRRPNQLDWGAIRAIERHERVDVATFRREYMQTPLPMEKLMPLRDSRRGKGRGRI